MPTCPATYTVRTPCAVTATAPLKPFAGAKRSISRSTPGSATTAVASISTRSVSMKSSSTPTMVLAGQWPSGKTAERAAATIGYWSGVKSLTKTRILTTSSGVAPAWASRCTTPSSADSACSWSVSPCPTWPDT